MTEVRSFIDGQFVNPIENIWFERYSPVTGEVIARVPDSDVLDLVRAIQAAHRAWGLLQKQGRPLRQAECVDFNLKIAAGLEGAADEMARLQSEETGAPLRASRAATDRAVTEFRFFASLAADGSDFATKVPPEVVPDPSAPGRTHRLPIGVVALILPAYEPVLTLARRLAPALAAGNVVIVKASSFAPRTGARLAEIVAAAGLPSGVFNLLQGRGERIGQAIVLHPGLSTISFTGKTANGRRVQEGAAEFLKRTHLALSGCSSVLIFDGVDLEKTARTVAALSLSGLTPLHLRAARIFVQVSAYKKFLDLLGGAVDEIKIGDPVLETTTLGPLLRPEEKTRFERAVAQAVKEKGKRLEFKGDPPPSRGNFVAPEIIYDVSLCSTLQQEEVTGPLAMVESFKYQLDALKLANNSPFGQIAYLFHPDAVKAGQIAARLEAGRIIVNPFGDRLPIAEPPLGASYGGLKNSGLGREGGWEAVNFFSRRTFVTT